MFKTIKSKMIIMQTLMIFIILGIMFVAFNAFSEDYYFNRKMHVIKRAFNYLSEKDIRQVSYKDKGIISFEEQKLRFIICDENFELIHVTTKKQKNKKVLAAKIKNQVVDKVDRYKENELKMRNGQGKISGRGIISQNGHKYYVCIYELKTNMKIHFSYYTLFFGMIIILVAIVGIIVSIIISNMICKPIKQIEANTREAVNNNYNLNISEEQEFLELSGLAQSINKMMVKIREQIASLEEEIRRKTNAENLRRQFVNNVSHEMKTPLAIISNQVEMLEILQDENKKKEYYQSIIEETEHMSQMINDMIIIYSIQNDEENLKVSYSDIIELVEFTCRDYDKLLEINNLTIHEEYPKECIAQVNEKFFTQAVSNYITNAIKHCKRNGNIYVRLLSFEKSIRVEVENDGTPIDERKKDNIWDMFYQGNDANLNGQKGSGLGLHLVKCIVEMHNGKYGFENKENGVIFYIELPKVQKTDSQG